MAESDQTYNDANQFLQSHAEQALQDANNAARRISAKITPELASPRVDLDLTKPSLQAPPKFSDMFPGADETSEEVARLNTEVNEWLARYFPAIDGCLQTIPDDWLCNIITNNNPFGLHESVFEAVWHNARDREEKQFRSEEATLRAEYSSRGFSLPPGAYATAMDRARQRASMAVSEVNRTEAIRNEEVKLQLLQFAVEQANRYKLGIMSSLAEFYRMWMAVPNQEIERARVKSQAYSALYAALGTYYNVEVAFEELRLRAESADVDAQVAADRNKVALYGADNAASGLGQAVRGFAEVSATAASAAGTLIAQIEAL